MVGVVVVVAVAVAVAVAAAGDKRMIKTNNALKTMDML